MKHTNLLVKVMLVALTFFVVACGVQTTPEPVSVPTETLTSVYPTETRTPTPTLTSTPEPTNTPTIVPTPIGGKSGLLLYQWVCPQSRDCVETILLYNLVSHELVPILDGYAPLDVSPDGKKVLLKKNAWETGDLFILDLSQPKQITLLHENVVDATWLGDSGWIGFISISMVNAKRQVFLIHPDGSDLMQITNSSVGAITLDPVFNDGVFWGEGTIGSNGTYYINKHKWTKMDGTETYYINYSKVFPSGKSIMTLSTSSRISSMGCKFDLIDVATSFKKEVTLLPPEKDDIDRVLPLTDVKWLAVRFTTSNSNEKFWIYSSDGNVLAELPNEYDMVDDSDPPSPYDLLSPDGNWILVGQFEKASDEQFKVTYRFFNITTSEIKDLPNLYYISTGMKIVGNRRIDGAIEGCRIDKYFWVEIP